LGAVHDVDIRPLASHDERVACVELQRATWGADFTELVPPSLLYAVPKVGGVAAGAFDRGGALLGFVFGITGAERGRLVHWSDMVAVRADAQGRGIGRALKTYQRDTVARMGVAEIRWTYDPLVAKNAHLNFNHYGVRVLEYVQDVYGNDTRSVLHRGVGTDRFVVAWPVASGAGTGGAAPAAAPAARPPGAAPSGLTPELRVVPVANAETGEGAALAPERFAPSPPPLLRIEIPRDIAAVQATSLEAAARWRESTRRAFLWALAHGYAVTGFRRDDPADRGYYLLTRA
jgi:chorismate synthase